MFNACSYPSTGDPSSPSPPSISQDMGTSKHPDLFLPGSRGDTKICHMFCHKNPDDSCTGSLNKEGSNLMISNQALSADIWQSHFDKISEVATDTRAGKVTFGSASRLTYDDTLIRLGLMHHEAQAKLNSMNARDRLTLNGRTISAFTEGNLSYIDRIHQWSKPQPTTEADMEELSEMIQGYSKLCQDYFKPQRVAKPSATGVTYSRAGQTRGEGRQEWVTADEHGKLNEGKPAAPSDWYAWSK